MHTHQRIHTPSMDQVMAHTADASIDMVLANHHWAAVAGHKSRVKQTEDAMVSNRKSMKDYDRAAEKYSRLADWSHLSEAERAKAKLNSDETRTMAEKHQAEYNRLSSKKAYHNYHIDAHSDQARFYDKQSTSNRVLAWFRSPPKSGKPPA